MSWIRPNRLALSVALGLTAALLIVYQLGRLRRLPFVLATDALRIMPVGDSITLGVDVPGGYRAPLYRLLTPEFGRIHFVGAIVTPSDPVWMLNARHDGYNGYLIDEIAAGDNTPIETRLDRWQPDIVLLHAGTNDIHRQHWLTGSPDGARPPADERLAQLVERITSHRPQTHVIVAQIAPTAFDSVNKQIEQFNSALAQHVARQQASGQRVTLVDMYTPLLPFEAGDYTGLHPGRHDYERMAAIWFDAIKTAYERRETD